MKIDVHRYTLRPGSDPARAAPGARHGALLRVRFEDDSTGYADLHPWEEFGHAPLADQLASLLTDHPAHLAGLALRHARTDAAARRAGLSLFDGLPEVRSHALFTGWTSAPRSAFEQCAAEGYAAAKLKIGRNPQREAEALNALADLPLGWRLDANASQATETVLASLSPGARAKVEFLEDPMPYAQAAWSRLSERENVPLAIDWELPAAPPPWPGAQILVLKPAAQEAFPLALAAARAGMQVVATHSMDHPLGQSVALWTAMRLRQRHGDIVLDGGLQAGGLYAPDEFSAQIQTRGPQTVPPAGTGFGFDGSLSSIPWQSLP